MRWNIDDEIRDQYSMGVHRDILIVPHATKVTPVVGGPPIITNKRPVFEYVKNSTYPDGMWIPKKSGGQFVLDEVDWVIDNSILVKEKFKYSYSLNSDDNLTFSGCNAAMVQFTIRNKKEYIEEVDENDEGTGNYYWEQEIPNLQNYEFVKKASDGTEKEITGELEGNMIIKVYTYINGDSSTIVCLGMFRVEEDKVVGNGYERQITAYDFMATFRDMDIFYWYKHLFDGINMATNDYEEFTKSDRTKNIDKSDETAEVNYIRQPREEWTIKDALEDLINNLAAYDMIVWEKEVDDKGKETGKMICKNGMTINNPSEYGRDYEEGAEYSGYGMPIVIDPDILTVGNEPYTPEEPGEDEFERYGYMKILEMPFQADPSILKKESLSMGKFLEDIGRLAGRYPFIRADYFDEHDYEDPTESTEENKNCYNNYERCILSFKPLPSSKDDSKLKNVPEMALSNHEIMKGFEHETYVVDDIEIVTAKFNDKTDISYHRLNKTQRVALQNGGTGLQTYTFSDNLFCSYLISKSDDEEIKKKLERYKELRTQLFGKEHKSKNMTTDALFYQGYENMKKRSYRPYKLTTYADPCRDVGDRIQITFEDKITGEKTSFYSYILERNMEGIQKMMDTYEAKGDISNPIFSNYQSGSKYQSSSSFQVQSLGYNPTGSGGASGSQAAGMSPSDLVQYWRNFGIRLLDEPSKCSALFSKTVDEETTYNYSQCFPEYYDENLGDYVQTWDGNYPTEGDTSNHGLLSSDESEEYITSGPPIDVFEESYFYDVNGNWHVTGYHNLEVTYGTTISPSFKPGDTITDIQINGVDYTVQLGDYFWIDQTNFNDDPNWGSYAAWYVYPGVWVNCYPNSSGLNGCQTEVKVEVSKCVQLKWTDPPDITDYKPTPATWEGTVIVRKENQPPLHRWDGTKVVRTTTRDKYKNKPYKDEDIKANKVYYYGFFPYYTKISDPNHPIRFYTFTKVIRVETGVVTYAPVIKSIELNGMNATINYSIIAPEGVTYTSIKLYGKIGSDPACDNTDDIIEDIDDNETSIVISDLDNYTYYFCIRCIDTDEAEVDSNIEVADLGFNWDGSEITILWSGNINKMTAKLVERNNNQYIGFTMYSNNIQIYYFESYSYFAISEEKPLAQLVKRINTGFLYDDVSRIAKPSFVYNSGSGSYSYNQESPTNEEMQDIYTWLQG